MTYVFFHYFFSKLHICISIVVIIKKIHTFIKRAHEHIFIFIKAVIPVRIATFRCKTQMYKPIPNP